jgi:hypothetical protein
VAPVRTGCSQNGGAIAAEPGSHRAQSIISDEKSTPITRYRNNFGFNNVVRVVMIPESLIIAPFCEVA